MNWTSWNYLLQKKRTRWNYFHSRRHYQLYVQTIKRNQMSISWRQNKRSFEAKLRCPTKIKIYSYVYTLYITRNCTRAISRGSSVQLKISLHCKDRKWCKFHWCGGLVIKYSCYNVLKTCVLLNKTMTMARWFYYICCYLIVSSFNVEGLSYLLWLMYPSTCYLNNIYVKKY